ncbi:hypothetical protein BASA62_005531 [Batrachochytrium salamandrivorans]|nr:hypothetical protein BASA62_005531 [Batrachochytrium salamandrivorans]
MPEDSGSNLSPREKLEAASLKLASDIDNVGSGLAELPVYMEKIGEGYWRPGWRADGGVSQNTLAVNGLLNRWLRGPGENLTDFIKAGLGDKEYSKIGPDLIKKLWETTAGVQNGLKAAMEAISNIEENIGDVIQNVETMNESFKRVFNSYAELFWALRAPMDHFPDGEKLFWYLADVRTNIDRFSEKQQYRFDIMMEYLRASFSQ